LLELLLSVVGAATTLPQNEVNDNIMFFGTNKQDIMDANKLKQDLMKSFNLLDNFQMSYYVKVIPITTTIQKIELHPLYTTKIYLPSGSKVISAPKSTSPFAEMNCYEGRNRCDVRPLPDLVSASIDITFTYENKIYDLTIIAELYDNSLSQNKKTNLFYPKIAFSFEKELEPTKVIQLYKQNYKELPTDKVSYFSYRGIVYKIELLTEQDFLQVNATVLFNGEKYRYRVSTGEIGQ
jgi:hypothetical protein